MIDLRSDTVTQPTPAMKEFMMKAPLGDDVLGDEPTVKELEQLAANLFGKEAALFCPSGTMTNQIAINVHTSPGDELICHEEAHIYRYEGGGIARLSGVSTRFIRGNQGRIQPDLLEGQINPDDIHYPKTSLVCIEDTANRGGGTYYDFEDILKIKAFAKQNNLKFHLDGARVFNALTENGMDIKAYAKPFDSISVCLSKGLGAPVGSLLLGSLEMMYHARRVRKVFGGGMRQSGMLAAAGIYALNHHVERLKEDHQVAREIAAIFNSQTWVKDVSPVYTNIVMVNCEDDVNAQEICDKLANKGILAMSLGKGSIRLVTHLDITEEDLSQLKVILPQIK